MDCRSGKHVIDALQEREGNPRTHSGTALEKTETSFNRIAWRHDKVLQTTREKAGTFKTNQNERISIDGRPRQESARLPTDTAKFRFKAQTRHRSHQRIHQRHHYRRTYLSNGSAHGVLA
jgi:hypothetical protein